MHVFSDLKSPIDRFLAVIIGLGIDGQLAETRQVEQEIGLGGFFKDISSLGLIKIADSPIRWINLREVIQAADPDGHNKRYTYYLDYGVPLTTRAKMNKEWIFGVRIKGFPIFGQVVRIRWKGGGWGRKVVALLNGDPLMGQPKFMDGINLTYYPEHLSWIISAKEWQISSIDEWNAYQSMALHLVTATEAHVNSQPAF